MAQRILTWDETKRAIIEGADAETAAHFEEAIELVASYQAVTKRVKHAKEYLNRIAGEWLDGAQFMDQDGVVYEMVTGTSSAISTERLLAAGVTQEQIDKAKETKPWRAVMQAKK